MYFHGCVPREQRFAHGLGRQKKPQIPSGRLDRGNQQMVMVLRILMRTNSTLFCGSSRRVIDTVQNSSVALTEAICEGGHGVQPS